ncbi:hypothetical protein ACSSS7_000839 [Eimeria intestinalis]
MDAAEAAGAASRPCFQPPASVAGRRQLLLKGDTASGRDICFSDASGTQQQTAACCSKTTGRCCPAAGIPYKGGAGLQGKKQQQQTLRAAAAAAEHPGRCRTDQQQQFPFLLSRQQQDQAVDR